MALQGITKNLRDGVITLRDGTTPTPNELELVLDEGDLSFTRTRNKITVRDRGRLSHRRTGDEQEVEVSFSAKYTRGYGDTDPASTQPTLADALQGVRSAATWVSTEDTAAGALPMAGPTGSELFSVDLEFVINDPTGGKSETITFLGFHADTIAFSEGDEYNTISVSGTALMTEPSIDNP